MRRINTPEDANISTGEISRWKDKLTTHDWDFHQLRITNAHTAADDDDYTTLKQLNPKIIFKIGTPLLGLNVTNRVLIDVESGVRLKRWHILANEGPGSARDIFDVRVLKKGATDFTAALSIFPPVTNDKLILPAGAIRSKGAKFHHSPYDLFYEEELIFDVLSIGSPAGTQVIVVFETQLLGTK